MMLDLLGPFPLLLVLLVSWGPVPLAARPRNVTRVQWFEIQRIRAGPVQCGTEMSRVNNYTQHCKPGNTFLHSSLQNVATTCLLTNFFFFFLTNNSCRNGQNNCYQSANRIGMTYCSRTQGTYPNCNYSTTLQNQFYVLGCERHQRGFPPNQLLPVHLDKTIPLVHLHFD
ncbi:ribonuclease K3-like [Enhydra lutris kenyoni]|uniref:Ribonuclease K3-like n=1 Tax=Enhydra lutris kenyoni TaxID=391180 RepID=A0A2Y9L700_ENHLU|nr:ribonuclease K3-like [Enhydra lutris kenyoni]